jgi:hypothetical protein
MSRIDFYLSSHTGATIAIFDFSRSDAFSPKVGTPVIVVVVIVGSVLVALLLGLVAYAVYLTAGRDD